LKRAGFERPKSIDVLCTVKRKLSLAHYMGVIRIAAKGIVIMEDIIPFSFLRREFLASYQTNLDLPSARGFRMKQPKNHLDIGCLLFECAWVVHDSFSSKTLSFHFSRFPKRRV